MLKFNLCHGKAQTPPATEEGHRPEQGPRAPWAPFLQPSALEHDEHSLTSFKCFPGLWSSHGRQAVAGHAPALLGPR